MSLSDKDLSDLIVQSRTDRGRSIAIAAGLEIEHLRARLATAERERDEARGEERLMVDAVIGAPHNQAVLATAEHAIGKYVEQWIARWADTQQDSPPIDQLAADIRAGAWRKESK